MERFTGEVFIAQRDDAIKRALVSHGPVAAAVYVTDAFQNYAGGVFDDC